jgi:hypothetical protein
MRGGGRPSQRGGSPWLKVRFPLSCPHRQVSSNGSPSSLPRFLFTQVENIMWMGFVFASFMGGMSFSELSKGSKCARLEGCELSSSSFALSLPQSQRPHPNLRHQSPHPSALQFRTSRGGKGRILQHTSLPRKIECDTHHLRATYLVSTHNPRAGRIANRVFPNSKPSRCAPPASAHQKRYALAATHAPSHLPMRHCFVQSNFAVFGWSRVCPFPAV